MVQYKYNEEEDITVIEKEIIEEKVNYNLLDKLRIRLVKLLNKINYIILP